MEVLRRIRHTIAIAMLIVAWPGSNGLAAEARDQSQLSEAQVRAGFLYNCAIFVAWPSTAFTSDEFVIGIAGDHVLSEVIKEMQGQKVNGRTLRVVPVRSNDDLAKVHILFVAGTDSTAMRRMLAEVGRAPILTVGEHDSFTTDGGVVRLYTDQGRLRFEINTTHAEDAGLRVSAKMLGLAKIVR
jgi:hypothetical protein